ncbi:protein MNN4-like [Cucumis melo var. makuwa]|uniref:Protein MNN4-like n=1 Tax=Cucumis melo var. makuwa TaxID=1194695 RepID=A0A5D3BT56_CUCMM|nr:protein MNN4-like [Cucumis melo var. makuwa]
MRREGRKRKCARRHKKKICKKTEKVKFGLLKIKVKVEGVKALAEEEKETKIREQEELLNQGEKVALFAGKDKDKEKTFDEHCKEFEKEIEELSHLEDKGKKIMPTRRDSTISMERIMLIYCIIEEIPVNIGEIISEHIIAWVKHPRRARSFSHQIDKLCLKACLTLDKLPQVKVKDEV